MLRPYANRIKHNMQNPISKLFRQALNFFAVISITLALVMGQAFGSAPLQEATPSSPKEPLVIGHRGAAGLAPENTLSAFKKALNLGVDAIELDVHLSADKILVVYHDFTLKPEITRASDGEWIDMWTGLAIKNLSLANLKTYDVGRLKPQTAYARRYPDQTPADGERIPALREVIALLKSHPNKNTQIWIEIKTSPEAPKVSSEPEAVAEAVLKLLQKTGFSNHVRILSFDWRALVYVQRLAPGIPTVYLSHIGNRLNNIKPGQAGPSPWTAGIDVDDYNGLIPLAIKAAGGQIWAPYYKYVNPTRIEEAHKTGLKVFVWTPDRKRDLLRLRKMGVDGIITNRPDILKSLFNR